MRWRQSWPVSATSSISATSTAPWLVIGLLGVSDRIIVAWGLGTRRVRFLWVDRVACVVVGGILAPGLDCAPMLLMSLDV